MIVEHQDCWPVWLIALVLPDDPAEALRRQKQRQARDKGRTLSPPALFLAGFVLLVTTWPASSWSTELLLELYRARWQVECPLSSWRLAHLAFESLRQVLEGHWTFERLRALLPELRRLFVERRLRPLCEHQRRYQFCQQVLCQADLVVLFGCSSA
jgi:hypothetical protein